MYPDVLDAILAKENSYFKLVAEMDSRAKELLESGDNAGAVEALTVFTVSIGDQLLKDWFAFFGQLFVKYRDGYITTAAPAVPVCGCNTATKAYDGEWYDRIVQDTGTRYLEPEGVTDDYYYYEPLRKYRHDKPSIRKQDLRAFQ